MSAFGKKIYTCRRFWADLCELIKKIPLLVAAFLGERISRAFASKLMLTVTAVNGCRYCSWFHTNVLLDKGVAGEEIRRILSLQIGERIAEYELTGIAYAEHYARSERNPDPETTKILKTSYGEEKANDILLFLELVYFANMVGNTFDAFLGRFRGQKSPGSSVFCEFMLFLLSSPMLIPMRMMLGRQKKACAAE